MFYNKFEPLFLVLVMASNLNNGDLQGTGELGIIYNGCVRLGRMLLFNSYCLFPIIIGVR